MPTGEVLSLFAAQRRSRILVGLLALSLFSVISLPAQSTDAAIVGSIADSQGGALSGVVVTAHNTETGLTRAILTDADGRYRLATLPPGPYELKAEYTGFASEEVKDVTLTIGLEYQRNFKLKPGAVQDSVTVTAETPITETTNSEAATAVINQEQIDSLPIPGRQATQLSLLLPGTGTDATRTIRPDANVGDGTYLTGATNYLVDGLNNMISGVGDPRDNIPEAAVQEFKVITSQQPAEYGQRTAGVVSLVTKSGTNQIHGEAFEYFRDHYINRVDEYTEENHNTLGIPIPPFSRNQYGVAIGGPVIKDRLHYFVSYERTDDREFFNVYTGKPQDYSGMQGTFQGGGLMDTYFLRTDYQIDDKQNVWARFFIQQPDTFFCSGCGGTNSAFSAADLDVRSWTYAAGHTWILTPTLLNQFTVQVAQSWDDSIMGQYTPSQYLASDGTYTYKFPSFSWGYTPGTNFHNFYQEVRDAFSINIKNHSIKIGAGFLNAPRNLNSQESPGTWTFATDQFFNTNDPNFSLANLKNPIQFTATFPTIPLVEKNTTYSEYVQDEWRVRPNLTLNLGVRYDLQTGVWWNSLTPSLYPQPLPYVTFGKQGSPFNLGPRVGLAWDPLNNGRWVVRAGYGILYANIPNGTFDGEASSLRQYVVNIKDPSYPNPYQGMSPLDFVSTAPPNIKINANNVRSPEVQNDSVGISHSFTSTLGINVDAVYSPVDKLPTTVEVNTPTPIIGQRALPAFGQIAELEPIGRFSYRALLVRLDKRFANRFQYTVGYTLASQRDNYQSAVGSFGAITNIYSPQSDWGPAPGDRRNNLVASGSALLRWGITLGAIWSLRSSLPFSALAGKDLNSDGVNNDYVPGTTNDEGNRDLNLAAVNAWRAKNGLGPIPASQIQSSRFNSLDIRLSKTFVFGERFKLSLIGQVFNALGTNNLGGVGTTQVTNALSSSFGEILTAQPRQQGELAARIVF
jgi:hypothetical protein